MADPSEGHQAARDFYEHYTEYARTLRTWLVAYGVGGPVLFITQRGIYQELAAMGSLIVTCFLAGAGFQVSLSLLNKWTNWYLYAGAEQSTPQNGKPYRFAKWINKWPSIDIAFDVLSILAFGIATALTLTAFLPQTVSGDLGERGRVCSESGVRHVAREIEEFEKDYTSVTTRSFYSNIVDACIYTEVAKIGVSFRIRDLSHTIRRDGGRQNMLLHCDVDGADSVILDRVRQYRGRVLDVPYREYLDDGFGGEPRALKTPDQPYTREDCQRVFDKWMRELQSSAAKS